MILNSQPFATFYDNNIDPFIPELWANESLAILEENMVATALVHRDFEPEFAKYGDIVHTRRPGEFVAKRKVPTDDVTVQDATATDVQVPLNQHIHVSFLIRDGEESKSFKDLIETYLAPAMLAQSRILDRVVLGQYPQFMGLNSYGGLGTLSANNGQDRVLGTRNIMNRNKAYMDNRQMILSPNTETTFLNLALFTQAQQVGDDGTALREAWLGRKFGYNMYMAQNMSDVAATQTTQVGAINHSGGYTKSTTTILVNTFSSAISTGQWFSVAGDDSPQQVISTVGGATPTSITFAPGLRAAVANSAAVTVIQGGTTLNASYAIGWSKDIAWTGGSTPIVGQFVTFTATSGAIGLTNPAYSITEVDTVGSTILLDRPLDVAVTSGDRINYGPPGSYNLAFHRNAMSLVVRPLAMPRAGTGALSAVVNHNDLSMRATITYHGTKQGHLVTLDMLCGIAILDTNLGAVLLG
jgi:P22 coat protein - gene protein 5